MRIVKKKYSVLYYVETFKTEEEAVKLANDTIYGLAGAVWSKDIEKAERVAPNCAWEPFGSMTSTLTFAQAPWGGYKQSGIRPRAWQIGLEEYTEAKHVTAIRNRRLSIGLKHKKNIEETIHEL